MATKSSQRDSKCTPGSVTGHNDLANTNIPATYATTTTIFCFPRKAPTPPTSGTPRTLQNACAVIGPKIFPVRNNKKFANKPKTYVYANCAVTRSNAFLVAIVCTVLSWGGVIVVLSPPLLIPLSPVSPPLFSALFNSFKSNLSRTSKKWCACANPKRSG